MPPGSRATTPSQTEPTYFSDYVCLSPKGCFLFLHNVPLRVNGIALPEESTKSHVEMVCRDGFGQRRRAPRLLDCGLQQHTPTFLEAHSLVVYPVSLIGSAATATVWVPGDAGTGKRKDPCLEDAGTHKVSDKNKNSSAGARSAVKSKQTKSICPAFY